MFMGSFNLEQIDYFLSIYVWIEVITGAMTSFLPATTGILHNDLKRVIEFNSYELMHAPWTLDYEHVIKFMNYELWIYEDRHVLSMELIWMIWIALR